MDTFDNTPDDLLRLTHKQEHPLDDIDQFINTVLLGYPPKNVWDDTWMTGETNDTTSNSEAASGSTIPEDKD
jgi:hypothetical protein